MLGYRFSELTARVQFEIISNWIEAAITANPDDEYPDEHYVRMCLSGDPTLYDLDGHLLEM